MKKMVYYFILGNLLLLSAQPSMADISHYTATINLVGRLEMLSQKIAKEKLLKYLSDDKARWQKSLDQSMAEFEESYKKMKMGDPVTGILVPKEEMLPLVNLVSKVWVQLKLVVDKKLDIKNKKEVESLSKAAEDITVLTGKIFHAWVVELEKQGHAGAGKQLEVSERQGVLCERIAKYQLLLSIYPKDNKFPHHLRRALQLFHYSNLALLKGNEKQNVPKVTDAKASKYLKSVQEDWEEFEDLANNVLQGKSKNKEAYALMAHLSEEIYKKMHKVTIALEKGKT